MPNWCQTRIEIGNEDKNELQKFYDKIRELASKDAMDNDFPEKWLGNLVLNAEIGTVDKSKDTDLSCRGYITDIEYVDYNDDSVIMIDTETAWEPMLKLWVKLIEKYLPTASLTYIAEEISMGLYCTNDKSYIDKYYIDAYDIATVNTESKAPKEQVIKVLKKLLNINKEDLSFLLDEFFASEYSNKMDIHKWSFSDITDWN